MAKSKTGDKMRHQMVQLDIQRKKAQAAALEQVNKDRAEINLPALTRIPALWWKMYGHEWLARFPINK